MISIRKVCQLMDRFDGHGGDVKVIGEVWQLSGSATVIILKGIRKVCQLIERCDGYVGGEKESDTCK